MIKLKSYRPFITENFIWEFPSHFKLKLASEFLDKNIAETTNFISQTAKETMSDRAVYWFVEDKQSHEISALIALKSIDFNNSSATIFTKFDDNISKEMSLEIIQRLYVFVNDQIKLNILDMKEDESRVVKFFTDSGYEFTNNKLKRK
ncbi:hypothetical protein [Companilactobacillus mishanensis]|uniref:GNAT family N-acetyltransferase n=1 Tax=Companilactobacillus mishanensis TaxID=2486008 RepID=A0A5P0ZHK7_9LACO|nr:hypothetical protein [Companilactobacillus mishanensis]MQS52557.1 hypothetical protein [Companilactobacillus mishanensis]